MIGERESSVVMLLRVAVLATAAAAALWDLAQRAGIVAGIVGTVAGVVVGHRLGRSALRLAAIWALGLGLAALALGTARLLESSPDVATALGPIETLAAVDVVRFGLGLAGLALAMRASGARFRGARLLELGVVVLALTHVLAVHREGAINRPLFLADWAWSRGLDPVLVLLWLGGGGALWLALLLISERRHGRVILHLGALVAAALAGVLLLRAVGPPHTPPSADALGLRGKGGPADESGAGGKDGSARPDRSAQGGGNQGNRRNAEEMPFRDDYDDQGQEVPVAVVLFGDDYAPPTGLYYFRQTAFSQFNGYRLVAATRGDVDRDVPRLFPAAEIEIAPPFKGPERTLLKTTVALMADHTRPFALDFPARIAPLQNPDPLRFRRAYEASSYVLAVRLETLLGRRAGSSAWSREIWAHYSETPSDPRYEKLAAEVVEAIPKRHRRDPFAQALAIKLWLDHNGIYSRRSVHAGAEDPTADFLFGDRTGYCVHFAHAAVYLMRARGLPARVAAGYAAAESARGNGSALLLRGGDAHAWPELYLGGVGWVTVDLTPERSLDQGNRPPDPGLQRMLGEMVKKGATKYEPPDSTPSAADLWRRAAAALRALLPLLAAVLLALYVLKVWRRLVPGFARARTMPRVSYRAALDMLAEAGLWRRTGETRESFAERAGPLAPSLARLTVVHCGAALGSRRPSSTAATRRLYRDVAREVARHVPLWRRLLGLLNPLAFLRST
jgi:protein-glutamine gamma-glutamyltransferase